MSCPLSTLTPYLPADPNCFSQATTGQQCGDRLFLTYSLEQNCSWKDSDLRSETQGSLSTLISKSPGLDNWRTSLPPPCDPG